MTHLFVHGGGADGPAGWPPGLAPASSLFLTRPTPATPDDPVRDAERLLGAAEDQPVHLVAQSYGGLAALLAARGAPSRLRSLTLFEPSCPDVASEAPSVIAFRRALEPVWDRQADAAVGDEAWLTDFAAVTGTPVPEEPGEVAALARRLRGTRAPWEVPLPRTPLEVPTLVVTGGWAAYFEDIARALVGLGARHQVLAGRGHDVASHPDAAAVLHRFTAAHDG